MATRSTLFMGSIVFGCFFCLPTSLSAYEGQFIDPWQMNRLFSPSQSDLKSEQAGSIFIYSELLDIDVERALDLNFERIESMMFIKTIVTDPEGKPIRHPDTGDLIMDDDC